MKFARRAHVADNRTYMEQTGYLKSENVRPSERILDRAGVIWEKISASTYLRQHT